MARVGTYIIARRVLRFLRAERPATDDLPELSRLTKLLPSLEKWGRVETIARVGSSKSAFPIHALVLGKDDVTSPILVLVGGVHGLERIGTKVVLAYMETLAERLEWDELTRSALASARIAFVPLLNPVGMAERRRSNGNGVDLMRNAPEAPGSTATPLVGGQRVSSVLPWYMGARNSPMEAESQALCDFIQREVFPAKSAIALDVHSGFGTVDRVWFPYAYTREPLPHLTEVYALKNLLDNTLPHHVYQIEPQARAYLIRGDLWDFLYDSYQGENDGGVFLPLTLEMGSWLWVRKNPVQALSALGPFNPIVPHRLRRTLRRHLLLIDFLYRAVASPSAWTSHSDQASQYMRRGALDLWYSGTGG